MTTVANGGSIDIHDVFESDITLAATPVPNSLNFRLERPDGTLAIDKDQSEPGTPIQDLGLVDGGPAHKFHVEFKVDMGGVWYWEWMPEGNLQALVQGWFEAIPEYIGNRTVVP